MTSDERIRRQLEVALGWPLSRRESRVPALFAVQRRLVVIPMASGDHPQEPERS